MQGFVTSMVSETPRQTEKPQTIDLSSEVCAIINVVEASRTNSTWLALETDNPVNCRLPREGFRVAIFSVLNHLTSEPNVSDVSITVSHDSGQASIEFVIRGAKPEALRFPSNMNFSTDTRHPAGLLVVERYARDLGGHLVCTETNPGTQILMMNLPCQESA